MATTIGMWRSAKLSITEFEIFSKNLMALDFVAGWVGGTAAVVVGYPLDTIKVRVQTQDASNPLFRSTWHYFTHTLKTESVRGIYRGISSPIAGVSFVNSITFGVYGNVIRRVKDPTSIGSQALAGGLAGLVQSLVVAPLDVAKIRMQIQSTGERGTTKQYKSPLHCLSTIARTEGVKGVFRGLMITMMREAPSYASFFATYEYLVRGLTPTDGTPSAAGILMAGGVAGSLSWVVIYPLDVIKSRLQADGTHGETRYRGMWHCFCVSVKTEGAYVMSRGLTTTALRAFPVNAANFFAVKWVMKWGQDFSDPHKSDTGEAISP